MRALPPSAIAPGHPDFPLLAKLRGIILERAGGEYLLRSEFPQLIRRAIDEVVDCPRTGRVSLASIEKTEKTYIGTKIEILFRDFLGLPKGLLDLSIEGIDVDIKNTVGSNWMIPSEAVNHPCVLIASDEGRALCHLGLFVARPDYLSSGRNRDGKRSIASENFRQILWLLRDTPYPKSVLAQMEPDQVSYVLDMRNASGSERLRRLFLRLLQTPISRDVVASVARQSDYMKRLRKNGGARDLLLADGVVLLSGKYDSETIAELGLPACTADEFIAVRASPENMEVLRARGCLG